MNDVMIVSAWDRGAWLAHQLQQEGFKTTVLDVSSFMPSVSSAEREGPFGVFLPSELDDLQKQYLCGDNYHLVRQGFSIFTSQGPMEFQGPLCPFFMETRKDFQLCHSVLSHLSSVFEKNDSVFSRKKRAQIIKEFEGSFWLLRLAAELTNSSLNMGKWSVFFKKSVLEKKGLNLFSPFFSDYVLRESSQRYSADLKYSLEKEGVEWIDASSIEKDVFSASEVKKKYRFLIWALSGPETIRCFPEWMPLLFPRWIEPVKVWRCFSLLWDQEAFEKIIPSLLLVLPECVQKNGTQAHSLQKEAGGLESLQNESGNLLSLKKHPGASRMDLWILCPYAERFNEQTLLTCLQSALDRLRLLFPHFSLKGFLPEIDSCQEYFVLYKNKNMFGKKLFYDGVHPRLFHLNPEAAGKVDAYSLMQQSNWIFKELFRVHSGRVIKSSVECGG